MAKYQIPNREGQIRQLNYGDKLGELWSTFNIDLHTSPGKIKLARPLQKVANSADLENETVVGFSIIDSLVYAVTEDYLFQDTSPYTSWTESTDIPNSATDITIFDGYTIFSTGNDDLGYYLASADDTDWWTDRGNPALATGVNPPPHNLNVIRIGAETLTVTDGNEIHAYTGAVNSGSGESVTVEVDSQFVITCARSSIGKVWIGTYTEDGDEAYVFEWDGASTNLDRSYPIAAKACLAMEIVDNTPLILTDTGEFKLFNGNSFVTIARFPFSTKLDSPEGAGTGTIQSQNINRPVHPKGMKRDKDTVFVFCSWINGENTGVPINEQTMSGIWALDLNTYSLSHVASPNNSHVHGASPLMVINDNITRFFIGGRTDNIYDDRDGIWIENQTGTNYGYFVTTEIESDSVEDVFKEIVTKALHNESSKIIVKYRTTKNTNYPLTIENASWAAENAINTTEDLSNVSVGDEIEVINGNGAGRLAHITSINVSTETYNVIIDENIGTTGELCDVRFDNWKKVPTEYTQSSGEVLRIGIGQTGTWGQFKVEMRGSNGFPEIRSVIINTNNKQSL